MKDKITIYEKPTCTTCRAAAQLLRACGVEFAQVNYFVEPLGEAKLRALLVKMQIAPRDLLRAKEPLYRELNLGEREISDDEIIALMVEHPELMQRPIVERGDRAVLGRPIEKIKAVLGGE